VAAVIARSGRYLLCQRPPHKRHGGLWEFPGGKLLDGESLEDAARRELSEELGIEVQAVGHDQFHHQDPGSRYIIHFVDVIIHGEPTVHEHASIAWVPVDELRDYALAPTDRLFVQHLNPKT